MPAPARPVALAVIVPTWNEADNVLVLARRLHETLDGLVPWEMIVVDDDSADGTADLVDAAALGGDTVRCVRRIGRRGLSSAVIEGCLATYAPTLVVMDADLQHDERVIPRMLERLAEPGRDLVVATRYAGGGSTGDWNGARRAGSRLATWMARLATPASQAISDPMSGFFAIRREAFLAAAPNLSGAGFKILLDIAASAPRPLGVAEVPYTFRRREAGESKLNATVVLDYIGMIFEKRSAGRIPARFVLFGVTGLLGLVVHMAVLYGLNRVAGLGFELSQTVAVLVAMTSNFLVNNNLTYRDRRLRGMAALGGLLKFYLVCGTGALSNVGVASFAFAHGSNWLVSGLAGVFVASVFNFAMSSRYVWSGRRRGG
ncbi:glycosyltransferase family 2 protein [Roseomonas sp. NAR14]|uniref:Glycosyltransferase family 2 protein n=1 Tax=Roseomonas acroporae TaxID=2937791 RepID=A0A9X1YAM2_9PROT|nr:glycosyltransferase family 2 protein [Roseomonas acroporae]MCK8785192.1 glycosyltransferase family 2 protein [Roseomonas acroporae]